jgi:hypothetical protein
MTDEDDKFGRGKYFSMEKARLYAALDKVSQNDRLISRLY